MMDVDMRSQLLTREKVKAIATMAKDCRAHRPMLHRTGIELSHDARAQPCIRGGTPAHRRLQLGVMRLADSIRDDRLRPRSTTSTPQPNNLPDFPLILSRDAFEQPG